MDKDNFKSILNTSSSLAADIKNIKHPQVDDALNAVLTCFEEFRNGATDLMRDSEMLKIGIVGQVKAGKSSFLNSLFFNGDDILPKASTPMTAGLTVLEYADANMFEVEYYTLDDWKRFEELEDNYQKTLRRLKEENQGAPDSIINNLLEKKASDQERSAHELIVSCTKEAHDKLDKPSDKVPFNSTNDIQRELNKYVGAQGVYTPVVKSLVIHLNDERLKDIRIVDTPGVNDPVTSRGNRTNEFLQSCHGVFFLSYSGKALDSTDVEFMNVRIGKKGIASVVLLFSKYDSVLQDLGFQYKGTAHEGDLDYADAAAQQNLKKRLNEVKVNFENEKLRNEIIMDTTSGIGYSIAKKDSSNWDSVEQNVVKQISDFYFGGNRDETLMKEVFMGLSNIDPIREKYLNDVFVQKKESIIQQKVNDFFAESTKDLKTVLENSVETIKGKKTLLESVDEEAILEQRKVQKEIFSRLGDGLKNSVTSFLNSLQPAIEDINEDIQSPKMPSRSDSMNSVSVSVTHKGEYLGIFDSTNMFSAEEIDGYAVEEALTEDAKRYTKEWQDRWKSHFVEKNYEMLKECNNILSDVCAKDMAFNDSYYRDLLKKAFESLERQKTLKLKDELDRFCERIAGKCSDHTLKLPEQLHFDTEKENVPSRLKQQSDNSYMELSKTIKPEIGNFTRFVAGTVEKNMKQASEELKKLRDGLVAKLEVVGEEELKKLEQDIKNKKEALASINCALEKVSALQTSLQLD